ncbi:MAG: filamentous hemagglutinin N-terminal domain-containing protein [Cyanobacteria bacterium J06639_14]
MTQKVGTAQLTPDTTLGAENSVVAPQDGQTFQIEGGAERGNNLFHSFETFSIETGQSVYFANPVAVENILTRVTGGTLSDIDGLLGVLGDANLFLLNPNGVIFGPNAQLDIAGSFMVSTAGSLDFEDGSEFSAIAPEASLLTISVPLGLQLNALPQGDVTNEAGLVVGQGQTLTLFGDSVTSTMRLGAPGGTAQVVGNRIELQDSADATGPSGDTALVFQAVDGIMVPDVADNVLLFARGTGSIEVLADANGDGVGDVVMVDEQDVLQTNGRDVAIAGVNLNLGAISTTDGNNAGGDVTLTAEGDISTGNITSNSFSSMNGEDTADGGSIAISSVSGDVSTGRINTSSRANGGNSGTGGAITISSQAGDITTNGNLTSFSYSYGDSGTGGAITITAQSGDITTNESLASFSAASSGDGGTGGAITITAQSGDIITNESLASFSAASSGDGGTGGAITITAQSGDITTSGNLFSSAASYSSGDGGTGGAITVTAQSGDVITNGNLDSSSSGDSGTGGAITLIAQSGNITTNASLDAASFSEGDAGSGGAITITSVSGDITTNDFLESSSYSSSGDGGSGGAITITSVSGDVTTNDFFYTASFSDGDSGSSGAITITSVSGDIATNDLYAFTTSFYGDSGNGGAITITSVSGDITTNGTLNSFSYSISGDGGSGGAIAITAQAGDIRLNSDLLSFSLSQDQKTGSGGTISLEAPGGSIQGEIARVLALSLAESGGITGSGGTVTLEAEETISGLEVVTLSSAGTSGSVIIQSRGDLLIQDTRLVTSGQIEIPNPLDNLNIVGDETIKLVDLDEFGTAGETIISSAGNLTLTNVEIQADANGSEPAGNVTITSPGQIIFNNSQVSSSANRTGNAAELILIEAARLDLGEGDQILAATSGSGNGGTILINATEAVFLGAGVQDAAPIISVEASGAGQPGNVTINTPTFVLSETARITATAAATATNVEQGGSITLNADQMELAGRVGIFAETAGQSPGGTLTLQPYQNNPNLDLTLFPGALVSASTSGSGRGGSLVVNAPERITIRGPGQLTVETSGSGPAGNIEVTAPNVTLTDGVTFSATTSGSGSAGDITLDVSESLAINGSTIESSTGSASTGFGGNIFIGNGISEQGGEPIILDRIPEVALSNGGRIAVDSESTRQGGDIELAADRLILDGGSAITAITAAGADGGNLTFNLGDLLLLRNDSNLSTTAGTNGAGGNGGNITIDIADGFIVAVPSEDSNIAANAFTGNGGRVTIEAIQLYGIEPRPQPTPLSDITASSAQGNPGTVESNLSGIIPESDLHSLPDIPGTEAIAQGCQVSTRQTAEFVNTGRGGIAASPGDPLDAEDLWRDLRPPTELAAEASANDPAVSAFPEPESLVESTGLRLDATGRIELITLATAERSLRNCTATEALEITQSTHE